jgi:hypothetical protein
MNTKSKMVTLLVALGFVLSALAVLAPVGATGGRAENFVVNVTFTNADDSNDNSSDWMEGNVVNITANVSIAASMDNVTDLTVELAVNGNIVGAPLSLGALNAGEFKEHTWNWVPPGYGDYTIMVTAVNGTDNANQTVKTLYYSSFDSDISITGVTAAPAAALIGVDQVTITATLSNKGNMGEAANVSFKLDETMDLGFALQSVVPAGGTADAVLVTTFTGLLIADGNHTVTAMMTDLSDSMAVSGNITLTNPAANITIGNLAVAPASGYEGDVVTFTVTLTNSGTADAKNITVDFSKYVIIVYMSIGELPNVTVAKGTTMNVTWAYTLPAITDATETQSIRAGYGEGFFLTTYKMVNITINKKLPKLEIVSFTMPTGKRVYDDVNAVVKVKNNGTANATGIVVKIMEGAWTYTNMTDPFNLTIGETKEITLGISLDSDGDINHTYTAVATVGGVESKKDTSVLVGHQIWASIGITGLKISPAKKDNQPKDSSQSYTATVTLKNTGEKAGSVLLSVLDGLKIVGNQTVSVDAGATKEVKVTFKVKGAGTHKIMAVAGLPNPDPGNMTKTANCELQYQPGFEVVVLISAILVALVVVRRRKN